jgi:hypothetical protein
LRSSSKWSGCVLSRRFRWEPEIVADVVGLGNVHEAKRLFHLRRPTVDAAEVIARVDVLQEDPIFQADVGDAEDGSV